MQNSLGFYIIRPMRFGTFDEVTEYLDSFSYTDKSLAPGILREARPERMIRLLERLGNPEKSYRCVHLAGSKGKGSTALYVSVILKAAGYRTGLYLSPHLIDYRERFTLAGEFFPDELMLRTAHILADRMEGFRLEGMGSEQPSTFEMYTAYAYLLFREAGCEYAVIETGIGGRLDATNTIDSFAELLLPVELEHTNLLGDTIGKIAVEKSKIIKRSSAVFCGFQKSEAMEVFRKEADEMAATFYSLAKEISSLSTETTSKGESASICFSDGERYDLTLSMRGEVQAQNAALALLFARKLGFMNGEKTLRAIEAARLPGRFDEFTYKGCHVIADVAHTKVSMEHTVSSFLALFRSSRRACIFACTEGKDTEHMLSSILPAFPAVIISRPGTFKKSNPEAILAMAQKMGENNRISLHEDAAEALECAAAEAGEGGAILIAGSFYLSSVFEELLNGNQCK